MNYKASEILPYSGKREHATIVLRDGDTMDDPSSTKRIVRGPARVSLTRHEDGGLDAFVIYKPEDGDYD